MNRFRNSPWKMIARWAIMVVGAIGTYGAPVYAAERKETVRPGESLATLSFRVFGTHRRWRELYQANRDQLTHPDRVEVGMKLRVPGTLDREPARARVTRKGSRTIPSIPLPPESAAALEVIRFEFDDVDLQEELENDGP